MRRRLRSEPWRHSAAQLSSAALAVILSLVLVAAGLLPTGESGALLDLTLAAPAILMFFALYGLSYFLLTHLAWRGLSGEQLRSALLRSMPPNKGLVRDLLVGTPTQMSTTAGLLSLAAVTLVAVRPGTAVAVMLISLGCVCGSWILVMTSFSVEYAREWAASDGFEFHGDDELSFSDFTYLAVQASTTYSTSDVATVSRHARQLVTVHAITAFIFATVILAFLVAIILNTLTA